LKHNHVCDILRGHFSKAGFPGVVFKYWGHDPDDIDMGMEEDGLSGIYDAFMVPDDMMAEFGEACHRLNKDVFEKELLFYVCIIKHDVSGTRQHYPDIYAEAVV
jgi:hypothetical protein